MRGSSAKSLDATLSAVSAVPGSSAAQVGAELFGVVAALDGAIAARRLLSDPSIETEGKRSLVAGIFGGKVGADTVSVLEAAVAGRWAAGRDLTDGLEIAGVAAYTRSADAAGQGDVLENELFEAGQVIHGSAELRQVISDRSVPVGAKTTLLRDVFGGKVSSATLALLTQAAVARTGSFERVLDIFSRQVAAREDRLVAVARVAYELDDAERDRLTAALSRRYGRSIQLNTVVDPSVIGGIAVSVGDEVVDATMSTRLEAARRRIAG
ncbi:F0F1 ATP synthase subunit delta [Aeromicrobium sp. 636]|uniref:ATP synthase subunit delta n=1 Tax=Aeromicrobium senzhongii TaxID=2663859 RepID=A0A8I0EWM5_9ACTN|nr:MULTISPECIES: F0F1 ATP synthase subunit delta [Aeromicrobium]MBC9226677.1 F0F1 ATP synthase subunit delta [Aeromicrobium senzhongii]MCQ3998778.1 F0F1 ATP synthase subunit delta [Aeromicrobium sp. 636]MTB89204.1 F0F1 ATP synthase subunit delta [Aeromicrobium senzhongii]QNL93531.1 F0F1 ATP synthase subunit delta [Aeromicrobium senzhongii]